MRILPIPLLAFLLCLAGPPPAFGCKCISYPKPFCARDLDGPAAEGVVVLVGTVRSIDPEPGEALYQQVLDLMPEEHRQSFASLQARLETEPSDEWKRAFDEAARLAMLALYADRLPPDKLAALRDAETEEQIEDAIDLAEMRRSVQFELRESFSGELPESVEVFTGFSGGDCGLDFEKGETYLVEAQESEDGRLYAGLCSSRVELLGDAEEDLAALRAWKRGEPRASSVYGYAEDWTRRRDSRQEKPPAADVPLRLFGGDEPIDASTDESGRFRFGDLAERSYRLELGLPGWRFSRAPDGLVEIDLTAGGCKDLFLMIREDQGSIRGRVRPQPGEELPEYLWIEAVPADPNTAAPSDGTARAPDGQLEIDEIEPGDYYVAVNVDNDPSGPHHQNAEHGRIQPYPPTYYPGTADPSRAAVFHIERGQSIELADWVLPARLAERRVSVVVLLPNGRPAKDARGLLRVAGKEGYVGKFGPAADDGAFVVWPLESLTYELEAAVRYAPSGAMLKAKAVIEPDTAGPLTLTLTPAE